LPIVQSLKECDLLVGKQVLPSFFIFDHKGARYKECAAGQQHGLDYEEQYASVCSYHGMCMILVVSAHENLELQQFDVLGDFRM
jgi:hypothetical protein